MENDRFKALESELETLERVSPLQAAKNGIALAAVFRMVANEAEAGRHDRTWIVRRLKFYCLQACGQNGVELPGVLLRMIDEAGPSTNDGNAFCKYLRESAGAGDESCRADYLALTGQEWSEWPRGWAGENQGTT